MDKQRRRFKCPMCGTTGALVSSKTVESLVIETLEANELYQEIMSLCMDKDCEMAIFC